MNSSINTNLAKRQKILFIGGSLNQTTMVHKIAQQLPEYEAYFSPFYAQGFIGLLCRLGLLRFTILGGRHRRDSEAYLKEHDLPVDYGGTGRDYDLVVITTDTFVPGNLRGKRIVMVQEGMIEPRAGLAFHLVKNLRLPRYFANTATTGLSDAYEVFCVASQGYAELFEKRGVKAEKIAVTGIPNFDDAAAALDNNFPHRDYVLAATSNARETFKWENRLAYILRARRMAEERHLPLIFKLHPNEDQRRSIREIRRHAPQALIFTSGNTEHMVANCRILMTQYSSVVYTGIALGKEVHSYLDLESLKKLAPIQNGGSSSGNIANICRKVIRQSPSSLNNSARSKTGPRPDYRVGDAV